MAPGARARKRPHVGNVFVCAGSKDRHDAGWVQLALHARWEHTQHAGQHAGQHAAAGLTTILPPSCAPPLLCVLPGTGAARSDAPGRFHYGGGRAAFARLPYASPELGLHGLRATIITYPTYEYERFLWRGGCAGPRKWSGSTFWFLLTLVHCSCHLVHGPEEQNLLYHPKTVSLIPVLNLRGPLTLTPLQEAASLVAVMG